MSETEGHEPGETRPILDASAPADDVVPPEQVASPAPSGGTPDGGVADQSDLAGSGADPVAQERARVRRPFIVLSAALLVVATFLGVLAGRYHSELTDERAERQQVQQVASRFATAFVTYDYRNLDASLQRIKAYATPKFANEYQRAFRTSIKTLIVSTQARSKGTVTDLFLGPIDGQSATVLTVLSVDRAGKAGIVPTGGSYLELDLVRVSGHWRVDNASIVLFDNAGSRAGPAVPALPGAATTTTVAK
ncbi:MAG: Mce-associated rane protein [Actinomycetota bacterium]|jgi:hypothetical protein